MSQGIPFFRGLGSFFNNEKRPKQFYEKVAPSLKLQTDKEVYRPGDLVSVTIDISNPNIVDEGFRLLVDNLSFEVKGIEKLDVQWFAKQPPLPGSRQKRGEHILLDCKTPFVISQLVVSPGCTKTYLVRAELPNAIPPSYRGSTVRYLYYVRSTLQGHWLENAHSDRGPSKDLIQLEVRIPLQIWITQKTSGLLTEGQDDENFPFTTLQMDVYWKEEGDSEWARASEEDAIEEGYDSSRDEISSVSSYNLSKGNLDRAFGSSLSLVSHVPRPSNKDTLLNSGERLSFSSYTAVPQLSATEVLYDSIGDTVSPDKRLNLSLSGLSTSQRINGPSNYITNDDAGTTSTTGVMDSATSEGFIRGRSYNIRLDDEILLRFSPKNSDSTYYFSDMIGGTLTFFHEEGRRRCLEVSITLETSETISRPYLHHSRKNSPTITKTQSDHHEVVADILQTSFLFSIPMDGPMSFSTPRISVQWALRFEFFTTPKNVDWTRYEHPLLVEGREKGEWILPITVHAPPPRAQSAHARNEKPLALGDLWIRS